MIHQSAWLLAATLLLSPAAPAQVWNAPTPIAATASAKRVGAVQREALTAPRDRGGIGQLDNPRGIFVGINQFPVSNGALSTLNYCVDDAIDMAYAFYDLGLLKPSEIYLGLEYGSGYTAATPAVKPETNAKLAELIREGLEPGRQIFVPRYSVLKGIFEEKAREAGEDSLFVFMLSTHGFEECYACQDSRVKSDRSALDPCLSVADLKTELTRDEVRVNRRLMLIDACRERKEAGARNQGTMGALRQDWTAWQGIEGLAVLLSATDGELSFEGKIDPYTQTEIRNGAFTHFILSGLVESRAEANQAGYITLGGLVEYVNKATRDYIDHNGIVVNNRQRVGISPGWEPADMANLPLAVHQRRREEFVQFERQVVDYLRPLIDDVGRAPAETAQLTTIRTALLREFPPQEAKSAFGLVKVELDRNPPDVAAGLAHINASRERAKSRQQQRAAEIESLNLIGRAARAPIALPDSLAGLAYSPPASGASITRSVGGGRVVGYSTGEITQGLYRRVMGNLPEGIPAFLTDDSLPVVMVSYNDAVAFCAKASGAGIRLRLPSVAEWKSLCTTPPTAVGGALAPSPEALKERLRQATTRTELIPAGGVWEWCTPDGGVTNGQAVVMGGSALVEAKDPCGLARPMPVDRGDYLTGFRVVIEQGP